MLRLTVAATIATALAVGAVAQETDTETTIEAQQAANADLKTKARKLGVSVGNAYACADEGTREAIGDDIQVMFDLMLKGAGSDIGFHFAAASGYGAAQAAEEMDCEAMLSAFDETLADFGLDEEEGE